LSHIALEMQIINLAAFLWHIMAGVQLLHL